MKYSEIDQVIRWYPTHLESLEGEKLIQKKKIDMYVHVPFCAGKCAFCPFNSKPINKQNLDLYFSNLEKEILMYANEGYFADKEINALWIGGGTPSAVPFERIEKLLLIINEHFHVNPTAEITLETNLHDLSEEYIMKVVTSRINRLSIGVQSFQDKYLKMMGRTYDEQFEETFFSFIKKYNLNISIDLMYRYPGETVEELGAEIEKVRRYKDAIDHITMYGLILFPKLGTYKQVAKGILPNQASLSNYERMNNYLHDALKEMGYIQYTTNHYSKPGKENLYNIDRWQFPQKECVSFGPGAFGQINDYIYCNEHDLTNYYAKIQNNEKPVQLGKKMTYYEKISRFLVLGIKCLEIDMKLYDEIVGIPLEELWGTQVKELTEEGLVEIGEGTLKLSLKGITYCIDVAKAFMTNENKVYEQPQYTILDMFEGEKGSFSNKVIECE